MDMIRYYLHLKSTELKVYNKKKKKYMNSPKIYTVLFLAFHILQCSDLSWSINAVEFGNK